MKIAIIMGRGIEGCGVTKFTVEQTKWLAKNLLHTVRGTLQDFWHFYCSMSYCIMVYYITLCCIVLYCIVFHNIILHYITDENIMSYYILPFSITV